MFVGRGGFDAGFGISTLIGCWDELEGLTAAVDGSGDGSVVMKSVNTVREDWEVRMSVISTGPQA